MIPGSMLILMATLGQLPGADCPANPPAVVSKPGEAPRPKRWLRGVSPIDGSPIVFLGWVDETGRQRFSPNDYPRFASATPPKAKAPAESAATALDKPTGVVLSKFPPVQQAHTWTGGNPAVTGQAPEKTTTPDVYVTIIGNKRDRDRVKAELARDPGFAAIAKEMGPRLVVEAYDPNNPLVKDVGLVNEGHPDIIVLDATGKEVARFINDPGPQPITDAVRKADPSYRPGGGKPSQDGGLGPGWIVLGVVAVAFVLWSRKGASQ